MHKPAMKLGKTTDGGTETRTNNRGNGVKMSRLTEILFHLLKDTKGLEKVEDLMISLEKDLNEASTSVELSGIINKLFVDIYEYDFATSKQLIHAARAIINKIPNQEISKTAKIIFLYSAREYFHTINGTEYFREEFAAEGMEFDFDELLAELRKAGDFELDKIRIGVIVHDYLEALIEQIENKTDFREKLDSDFMINYFKFIFPANLKKAIEISEINGNYLNTLRYLNSVFSFFSYILIVYTSIINGNINNIIDKGHINKNFLNYFVNAYQIYLAFLQKLFIEKKDEIIKPQNSKNFFNPKTIVITLCNLSLGNSFIKLAEQYVKQDIIGKKSPTLDIRIDEAKESGESFLEEFKKQVDENGIEISNKVLENFLGKISGMKLKQDKTIETDSTQPNHQISFVRLFELYEQILSGGKDIPTRKKIIQEIGKILADISTYSDLTNMRLAASASLSLNIHDRRKAEIFREEAGGKLKESINSSFRQILTGPEWKVNLPEAIDMLKTCISLLTGQLYDEKNTTFKILIESDKHTTGKFTHQGAKHFEENDIDYKKLESCLSNLSETSENKDLKIETIYEKGETGEIKGYITYTPDLGDVLIVPFGYSNFQKKEKTGYLLIRFTFSSNNLRDNLYIKDNGELRNILVLIQNKFEQLKKIFWLSNYVMNQLEGHHKDTAEHSKRIPFIAKIIVNTLSKDPSFENEIGEIGHIANRMSIDISTLLHLSGLLHDVGKKSVDLKALDSIKFSEYHLISLLAFLKDFIGTNGNINIDKLRDAFEAKVSVNDDVKTTIDSMIRNIQQNPLIKNSILQNLDKLKTFSRLRTSKLSTHNGDINASIYQLDLFIAELIKGYIEQDEKGLTLLITEFKGFFDLISDEEYKFIAKQLEIINKTKIWNKTEINKVLLSLYIYYSIETDILKTKVKQPHIIEGMKFFNEHPELQLLYSCLLHHIDYPTANEINENIGFDTLYFNDPEKKKLVQKLRSDELIIPPDLKPFLSVILTIADVLDALMGSRSYHDTKQLKEKYERSMRQLRRMKKKSQSKIIEKLMNALEKDIHFKEQVMAYFHAKGDEVDGSRHVTKIG